MKLRYYHTFEIIILIVIVLIFLLIMSTISFGFDSYDFFAILFICPVLLILGFINYEISKIYFKIAKKNGYKVQGYIVDFFNHRTLAWSSRHRKLTNRKCAFKCLVDGEIEDIVGTNGISNNNAYSYVCSELKKLEDLGNGKFKLRSFPIDVYVYKNKYYFDLDSVKLDMKN